MNAKFEKWIEENGYDIMAEKPDALRIWQAAIQSLEVTPELRSVFWVAMGDTTPANATGMANHVLTQILSALKEQAK